MAKRRARSKQASAKASATCAETRRAQQIAFLEVVAKVGVITQACKAFGMDRQVHYDWMRTDADYPALFADARLRFVEMLKYEATALATRGIDGLRSYKFYRGEPIMHPVTGQPYYEDIPCAQLLLAQLKAYCPQEYSERHLVKHEGNEVDLDEIPVGPGEPEQAFHDFVTKVKKYYMDKVKVTEVTTLSIAERAAAIKARRSEGGNE